MNDFPGALARSGPDRRSPSGDMKQSEPQEGEPHMGAPDEPPRSRPAADQGQRPMSFVLPHSLLSASLSLATLWKWLSWVAPSKVVVDRRLVVVRTCALSKFVVCCWPPVQEFQVEAKGFLR